MVDKRKGLKIRNPEHRKQFAQEYIIKNDANTAISNIDTHLSNNATAVKAHRWIHDDRVIQAIIDEVRALNLKSGDIHDIVKARLLKIILGNSKDGDAIQASGTIAKIEGLISEGDKTVNVFGRDALDAIIARTGLGKPIQKVDKKGE